MNQNAHALLPEKPKAPKVIAIVCLLLAWLFAILPIPLISTLLTVAFNIVAFILAIVCLTRQAMILGISVIIGTAFTIILYVSSYPLLFGSAFLAASKTGHLSSKPLFAAQSHRDTEALIDGAWAGEYFFSKMPSVKFSVNLSENKDRSITGKSKEVVRLNDREETIEAEWTGTRTRENIRLDKIFTINNTQQKIRYEGNLASDRSRISGNWSIPGTKRQGTFKLTKTNK